MRKETKALRVDPVLWKEAKTYAVQEGISLSNLVMLSLSKYMRGVNYDRVRKDSVEADSGDQRPDTL